MRSLIRFLLASLMLLSISSVYGGTIKGKVTDAASGEALLGANVTIVGTSLGAAADKEGRYSIQNVPIGVHTVRFSYVGYNEVKHTVTITKSDQTVTLDAKMEMGVIVGKEFIVSAQAVGQLSAINQQLSAPAMMNVVDAARIRELPDQNAAEAISRLPGVTISRNNGEGSGVGIRGLAPQYNLIQIDGVTMSPVPNMGRADFGDAVGGRGVSLSSVSQENLSGIEVFKAMLPDMDAATLGGTVNMRLGRAPARNSYEAKVFGAYNSYVKDWKNYKLSGKATSRLFDDAFGIQISVDAEGRNRSNDRLAGSVVREESVRPGDTVLTSRYKVDNPRIINTKVYDEKKGFNAIFDYLTEGTELLWSNFYSSGARTAREINRDKNYIQGARTDSRTYSFSSSLRGNHKFTDLELEWQFSHNKSKTETPDDYQMDWNIETVGSSDFNKIDLYNITPEEYIKRYPNLEGGQNSMTFRKIYQDFSAVDETKTAVKLDLKYNFIIGEVSGFLKTGALLRQSFRTNWLRHLDTFNGRFAPTPKWSEFQTDYNPDPVLNGLTTINLFFDVDKIQKRWPGILADPTNTAKYDPLNTPNNDYRYTENFYAGYVMVKLNAFDDMLTFIPGFRYEGDDFDALGHLNYLRTSSTESYDGEYKERRAKQKHGFFLPMLHLKFKPANWFDVRLAATKTISRPNSLYLVPFVSVSYLNSTVTVGNPDLKTTESTNYDLSLSVYDGKLGLVTVSGFHKEITNFSYRGKFFMDSLAVARNNGFDFETDQQILDANALINIKRKILDIPINTPGVSTVKGFEIDYQANLMFLPGLLKNLVFNINYTRIWSKSQLRNYRVKQKIAYIDPETYEYVEKLVYDPNPTREGPLQTQPDHILNVSLGYDIGGFSGRVSAFYQGRSLSGVGDTELGDSYIAGYLRYDMSVRYRFSENISLLLNGVNLTSTPDISTLSGTDLHSNYSIYGTMFDFGVQVSF